MRTEFALGLSRPAVEKSLRILYQIFPLGINRIYQSVFLLSPPPFQLFLSFKSVVYAFVSLRIYKLSDMISFCKTVDFLAFMFKYTTLQISRHAYI